MFRNIDATSLFNSKYSSVVPSHWPTFLPDCGYQLLSVSKFDKDAYVKIQKNFETTMESLHYEILSIEEICNKEYYNKYAR